MMVTTTNCYFVDVGTSSGALVATFSRMISVVTATLYTCVLVPGNYYVVARELLNDAGGQLPSTATPKLWSFPLTRRRPTSPCGTPRLKRDETIKRFDLIWSVIWSPLCKHCTPKMFLRLLRANCRCLKYEDQVNRVSDTVYV